LPFDTSVPPKKKLKSDSETIASVTGGNNGLGSALVICKFSRLMHYIHELVDVQMCRLASIPVFSIYRVMMAVADIMIDALRVFDDFYC
jgi:hypothetical protein